MADDIAEAFRQRKVTSKFDKTPSEFIPQSVLEDVITEASVTDAMEIPGGPLVDFVLSRAMHSFAIIMLSFLDPRPEWLREALQLFLDCGFDDTCLPVEDCTIPVEDSSVEEMGAVRNTFVTTKKRKSFEDVQSLDLSRNKAKICWRPLKIHRFCENQWKFLAPVFSTQKHNNDISKMAILPFTWKFSDLGQGSFGRVYKYKIHPDHIVDPQSPGKPCPTIFAVKEILPLDTEDRSRVATHWASEANALATMNDLNQDHIVRFVTAFRRYDKNEEEYYLMFECADGGSLQNLWKEIPRPKLTTSLIKAAIVQLRGLARALAAAHYPEKVGGGVCRHGDLKPANILWFRNGGEIGTLKIGDWGEAKIQNQFTELRPNKTTAQFGTIRYEAPESRTGLAPAFKGQPRMRRSRLYDIWAMGCVTLEFIIWLLYGTDVLNHFNKTFEESPFYQWEEKNGERVFRVHDIATRWMDHMALEPACEVGATALGDLLEIVRTGLLVVRLPRRLGRDVNSERIGGNVGQPAGNLSSIYGNEDPLSKKDDSLRLARSSSEPVDQHGIEINIVPAATEDDGTLPEIEPLQQDPVGRNVPTRLLAIELKQRLENILPSDDEDDEPLDHGDRKLIEDNDEGYWLPIEPRLSPPGYQHQAIPLRLANDNHYQIDSTTSLLPSPVDDHSDASVGLPVPERQRVDYAHPNLDDEWDYAVDNEFSYAILSALKTTDFSYGRSLPLSSNLCSDCLEFSVGLSRPAYSITYRVLNLEYRATSKICDLCILLWKVCRRYKGRSFPTAQFDKKGSFITMNGRGDPVLSIVRTSDRVPVSVKDIQIAPPQLFEAGVAFHFEILRQWLLSCDEKHTSGCCGSFRKSNSHTKSSSQRLPTRLIHVGAINDEEVRLCEMAAGDTGEWLALSHQWGPQPHFSTTRLNLDDHLKGIKIQDLPATFRDAVKVTRALHHHYLWIDSICIIQGPDGDFNEEARHMEEVYSGAYCVLAASCSNSHFSGFLKPRHERDFVGLNRGEETPLYICGMIDDFQSHVLEGGLNSRGWVMQEHALARRTIFFTEYQTYWECGEGVRCETMTKMRNNLAAFQGDPNFPQILIDAPQGERILRLQELYRTYSRLGLSNAFDRPMAVDGLQRRLLRTLHAAGGYGVFDEGESKGLLRRSLLWRRGADSISLGRIRFPPGTALSQVPSWSWMAYTGGIDYLGVGFGQLDWENIKSPWSAEPNAAIRTDLLDGKPCLTVTAYEFNAPADPDGKTSQLILDTPGGSKQEKMFCVVLGKQKEYHSQDQRVHYLMLIAQAKSKNRDGHKVFERVGAGYLPGGCIERRGFQVNVY